MSGVWFDRAGVVLIVVAAGAYLARRLARRASAAFGRRGEANDACGSSCGCERPAAGSTGPLNP